MIPKASQRRGAGRTLATLLQNAFDNEYVEIADLRGAVARDLHGAFAEWELCAHAMTGCRNCTLQPLRQSRPTQGQRTARNILDYVDRVQAKLNFSVAAGDRLSHQGGSRALPRCLVAHRCRAQQGRASSLRSSKADDGDARVCARSRLPSS